ncbi:hypothetical protein FB451DRAFT_1298156 [Mycena latifolia]|nr:hypothetical protein FB451DRAFT_1298156 [Mycena latifolia]
MDISHLHIRPSPLRIKELIEQCIEFLCDSPADLKACALVSRSWTSAAQGHLFKEIAIRGLFSAVSWPRGSPYLIRHIRCLQLNTQGLPQESFSAICNLPFTHLRQVTIYHTSSTNPFGLAIQQLLSLPSLTRVKLVAHFITPSRFLQIWERVSPSIRHLKLYCYRHPSSPRTPRPIPDSRSAPVALESLELPSLEYINDWLLHDLCPLDVSRLRFLSIASSHEPLLRSAKFAAAFRTLEVLDLSLGKSDAMVDISTLPNLSVLRLCAMHAPMLLNTVSTIPASSRIRHIFIWRSSLDRQWCDALDSKIISLPVERLPTLELCIDSILGGPTIDNLEQYFPQLASRNLVCPSAVSSGLSQGEWTYRLTWYTGLLGGVVMRR